MKKKSKQINKFILEGLNTERLINQLISLNIQTYNFKKTDYNKLEFETNLKDADKVRTLVKRLNFKCEEVSTGLAKTIEFFKYRFGILIGLVLSIIFIVIINSYTFNFKILGIENITSEEVETVLKEYGIEKFKRNSFEDEKLEMFLIEKLPRISMVSVAKKGTTIIINIKEKLKEYEENYLPIVASENMLITNMQVYAGYTNKKVGDSVMAGETLVEPYIIDANGEKKSIEPKAFIEGKVWYTSSETFEVNETKLVRTGKKIILSSEYLLGNGSVFKSEKTNTFENYEIEESEKIISYIFLPIKLKNTIAYELKEEYNSRNFEDFKDEIVARNLSVAYSKVPANALIDDEKVVISNSEDKYFINVYLESSVVLGEKLNEN